MWYWQSYGPFCCQLIWEILDLWKFHILTSQRNTHYCFSFLSILWFSRLDQLLFHFLLQRDSQQGLFFIPFKLSLAYGLDLHFSSGQCHKVDDLHGKMHTMVLPSYLTDIPHRQYLPAFDKMQELMSPSLIFSLLAIFTSFFMTGNSIEIVLCD